jgi:hypothetical protein
MNLVIKSLLLSVALLLSCKISFSKEYFHTDVIEMFKKAYHPGITENYIKKLYTEHPYIPRVGTNFLYKRFRDIDDKLINKLHAEEKIKIEDFDIDNYVSKSIYFIQNIIGNIKNKDDLSTHFQDFKNIIITLHFGNYLHDNSNRAEIAKTCLKYLSIIPPQKIYEFEYCKDNDESILSLVFGYLYWGVSGPTHMTASFGELSNIQKNLFKEFHYEMLKLSSPFSKLNIDTLIKMKLHNLCDIHRKENFQYEDVISPRSNALYALQHIDPEKVYSLATTFLSKLKENPYFLFATSNDIKITELYKKLSEEKQKLINHIQEQWRFILTLNTKKQLFNVNLENKKFIADDVIKQISPLVNSQKFVFLKTSTFAGLDVDTCESLGQENYYKINECLYYISTLIDLIRSP